ncbi:hypothetical protein LINPERHAP2_LOCUS14875 [Linum perenne]
MQLSFHCRHHSRCHSVMEPRVETEPTDQTNDNQIKSGKIDVAWNYFAEEKSNSGKKVFKCLFCAKTFKGGAINRMKKHIAGIPGEIVKCVKVPHDVREKMHKSIKEFKEKKEDMKKLDATIGIDLTGDHSNAENNSWCSTSN